MKLEELCIDGVEPVRGTLLRVRQDATHVFAPGEEVVVYAVRWMNVDYLSIVCIRASKYKEFQHLDYYFTYDWNSMLLNELEVIK